MFNIYISTEMNHPMLVPYNSSLIVYVLDMKHIYIYVYNQFTLY